MLCAQQRIRDELFALTGTIGCASTKGSCWTLPAHVRHNTKRVVTYLRECSTNLYCYCGFYLIQSCCPVVYKGARPMTMLQTIHLITTCAVHAKLASRGSSTMGTEL